MGGFCNFKCVDNVSYLMGLIACSTIIMLIMIAFRDGKQSIAFGYQAKYTVPIF